MGIPSDLLEVSSDSRSTNDCRKHIAKNLWLSLGDCYFPSLSVVLLPWHFLEDDVNVLHKTTAHHCSGRNSSQRI